MLLSTKNPTNSRTSKNGGITFRTINRSILDLFVRIVKLTNLQLFHQNSTLNFNSNLHKNLWTCTSNIHNLWCRLIIIMITTIIIIWWVSISRNNIIVSAAFNILFVLIFQIAEYEYRGTKIQTRIIWKLFWRSTN